MKKLNKVLLVAISAITLNSCKKEQTVTTPSASLTIVNVVIGGGSLSFNSQEVTVDPNSSNTYPILSGKFNVKLLDAYTDHQIYYDQTLTTNSSDRYSLFLTGTNPESVENVKIKETYANFTDSLCGVRFINLSPGNADINVNIAGSPNGSEVASLAYKAYSEFNKYPAQVANSSYAFEFRNAATGALIASYNLLTPYFHNVTLVLQGNPGSEGVIQVNHL